MNNFERQLLKSKPLHITLAGVYEVRLMTDQIMGNYFGYALQNKAFIRANLNTKVERFVISHEIYHLKDTRKWLGWFGSELRANIVCGVRDPIGFMFTIKASLNKKRLRTYGKLLGTQFNQNK